MGRGKPRGIAGPAPIDKGVTASGHTGGEHANLAVRDLAGRTGIFRHRSKIGLSVALEGLQEALRQRKTTPAEVSRQAERGGVSTVIRPYLEALTANA